MKQNKCKNFIWGRTSQPFYECLTILTRDDQEKKQTIFFNPLRELAPHPGKFSALDHYIKKCRRQVNQLDFNRKHKLHNSRGSRDPTEMTVQNQKIEQDLLGGRSFIGIFLRLFRQKGNEGSGERLQCACLLQTGNYLACSNHLGGHLIPKMTQKNPNQTSTCR